MTFLLFLLFVGLGIGGYSWSRQQQPSRADQLATVAERLSFEFTEEVAKDPSTLPFAVFGTGGHATNMLSGALADRRMRLFDCSVAGRGLSCALAELPASVPVLTITPTNLRSLTVATPAPPAPVDAAFDAVFELHTTDAAAAQQFLTPAVRSFLIEYGRGCIFELNNRLALCATEQVDARNTVLVLKALCAFLEHVAPSAAVREPPAA